MYCFFQLPKLTKLDAIKVGNMCNSVVGTFANMEVLALDCLDGITNRGISTLLQNNPKLVTLSMSKCTEINDFGN